MKPTINLSKFYSSNFHASTVNQSFTPQKSSGILNHIITVKVHAVLVYGHACTTVIIDNTPLNGNNVVHQFVTLFVVISAAVFKFLVKHKL